MPKNAGFIGVFDSGIGGLTILQALVRDLPRESFVYVADNHYLPYGGKSEAEVLDRALRCSEFLLSRGAKAIVVACNTATAIAIDELRLRFTVPVIGVEPAIKPAVARSRNGQVGVMTTRATASSLRYQALVAKHADSAKIFTQACPGLVEAIESADQDLKAAGQLAEAYLSRLLAQTVDTVVLGCTHYPWVRENIEHLAGPGVHIFDTANPVSEQLQRKLQQQGLLLESSVTGQIEVWASGEVDRIRLRLCNLIDISAYSLASAVLHQDGFSRLVRFTPRLDNSSPKFD